MTINEALNKEMSRGKAVIYVSIEEPCHLCSRVTELRAGACFECKDHIETDMISVWDRDDPANSWPYVWQGPPAETSETVVSQAQKLAEKLSRHRGNK